MLPRIRQLLNCREFRRAITPGPEGDTGLEAMTLPNTPAVEPEPVAVPGALAGTDLSSFLSALGTSLWRLRQRMLQPGTDRPFEEMRLVYRHLESAWTALAQAGVTILDHTGQAFHYGQALKVISYQPTPSLVREEVIETLRPTIYFKDMAVQMGEVVVGTPDPPLPSKALPEIASEGLEGNKQDRET